MRKRNLLLISSTSLLFAFASLAADHLDSPAATSDPTADIADVFAWTNEQADKLNLVMTVNPFASESSQFGSAVQYVFHVNSAASYGAEQTETLVICQFYEVNGFECWAGDEYLSGNPSDRAGITSQSGGLRAYAGLTDDPFFFEFRGFSATVAAVTAAAPSLNFDEAGCPQLDGATASTLVQQLQSGPDGEAASDTFAGSNVLTLAIEIDSNLVNAGGPIVGVWASTHRNPTNQ